MFNRNWVYFSLPSSWSSDHYFVYIPRLHSFHIYQQIFHCLFVYFYMYVCSLHCLSSTLLFSIISLLSCLHSILNPFSKLFPFGCFPRPVSYRILFYSTSSTYPLLFFHFQRHYYSAGCGIVILLMLCRHSLFWPQTIIFFCLIFFLSLLFLISPPPRLVSLYLSAFLFCLERETILCLSHCEYHGDLLAICKETIVVISFLSFIYFFYSVMILMIVWAYVISFSLFPVSRKDRKFPFVVFFFICDILYNFPMDFFFRLTRLDLLLVLANMVRSFLSPFPRPGRG